MIYRFSGKSALEREKGKVYLRANGSLIISVFLGPRYGAQRSWSVLHATTAIEFKVLVNYVVLQQRGIDM